MQQAALKSEDGRLIQGVSLELLEVGSGPPLLFLHPQDGIEPDAEVIAEFGNSFRTIVPSHPGFGDSDLPRSFSTVDDLAYFYLDFMDELNLEDVTLVGVSLGAWIAAEIAIKSTRRISHLVLADAIGMKWKGRLEREITDLLTIPLTQVPKYLYADEDRHATNFRENSPEALKRIARNRETFTLLGWSPTMHNPKLAQRLHRIDVPTLVLWGSEDRVVPIDYGQSLSAAIPGSSFAKIDGAGHYPHIEKPKQFVKHVAEFAAKGSLRAGADQETLS